MLHYSLPVNLVRTLVAAGFAIAPIFSADATEIRVLTGNALRSPLEAAGDFFADQTGHQMTFLFTNPSIIQQKLDIGQSFDLLVIPSNILTGLDQAGKLLVGTRRALARVGVGIAAREGGPKLDFSTPEAFRKMLLEARAITYSDASSGGLSAVSVQKVLENLGVADAVKAKAVIRPQGQELIAKGEVDFGLFNVSEIPRAPGVVLAGTVPSAVQAYLDYDAAIPLSNKSPETALQLLDFLGSPEARKFWDAVGIEQVEESQNK